MEKWLLSIRIISEQQSKPWTLAKEKQFFHFPVHFHHFRPSLHSYGNISLQSSTCYKVNVNFQPSTTCPRELNRTGAGWWWTRSYFCYRVNINIENHVVYNKKGDTYPRGISWCHIDPSQACRIVVLRAQTRLPGPRGHRQAELKAHKDRDAKKYRVSELQLKQHLKTLVFLISYERYDTQNQ